MWQSSRPGSIYDYIKVASFSLGPDGRIDQWSERAEQMLGIPARHALGKDPVEAFVPREFRETGRRKVSEILDGREWTGLVPYRRETDGAVDGLAEIYVMPAENEDGERGAVCLVVDVRALRGIETDLAAAQAVFGQSPMGFTLFGTDLKLLRVNERFATVFGGPPSKYRGGTPHDFLPRPEAERMTAALRRVLETGEPVSELQLVGHVPGEEDRRRWSISLYRLHGASGRPIGVAALASDVTGRRRAEREAANARRNLALLNEAGARIGNSLDLETTARTLLDVAVPQFCDLASVDLYQGLLAGDEEQPGMSDGSAELRRVAFASAVSDVPLPGGAPEEDPVTVGAVHRYPFNSPCAAALRTAQAQIVPGREGDEGPELGAVVHSTLAVPMVARDTVVGLVRFSRTKGSEPFGERDTALAVELAARAAVCIDNARLYRREHERALILQRSLLPPGDPEAAGLDIACRYLPGTTATEVGGDWFDVIELPGHRTALVVGDVMGRGLRAAVAMGELRTAVRTLALLDLEPAEVLGALDEIARGLGGSGDRGAMARTARSRSGAPAGGPQNRSARTADLSEVYLATCVYAVYDPITRVCTFANAGHLPPVLVEEGEEALLLDVPPGMPLGVGGEPFEEIEVEVPDGALLALYTDGLVESRHHPLDEGLQAFRRALSDADRPLEDVCDHVLSALDTSHGEDDIALLMARVHGLPKDAVGDWSLAPEPRSVARARELARDQLTDWGLQALVDTTELLVSELVTNALRHGHGEIRLRLLLDRTLVCEVWDADLAQPRRRRARDTDEGGRGLQLVGLLSERWGSRRTPRGKTVWYELALPDGDAAPVDPAEALLSLF
ncbi:SpoIIE family protein phosphatase [Streptomyces noursei]|uniref:SpoIIE family protein phosphatase n=1 Tax=Streptomyces TaxID=1883 RepID=UPI0003405445|nr:SpoIIE family protein phosphatase [Streptomyces noursei]AKA05825.1 magnesium or manganese-dependent protein phosphatase [Streptomyces noursei ZPM]EOT03604.1 magnesium or manganese-dependent protein phosphatase [Streptomyces noursei CCRC 11814]EXU85391.1 PAS/PAC sensor protein [Streptomyces noursei PD-1]UWS74231.1 SpoIIE family protein phosphatase [Streptomyces noursei]